MNYYFFIFLNRFIFLINNFGIATLVMSFDLVFKVKSASKTFNFNFNFGF